MILLQFKGDNHPISPVMLGDAKLASQFADLMLGKCVKDLKSTWKIKFFLFSSDEGIYVIGFSFPVVPKGKARIRVQISASHTTEDIDKCVNAFKTIGKKLGVI